MSAPSFLSGPLKAITRLSPALLLAVLAGAASPVLAESRLNPAFVQYMNEQAVSTAAVIVRPAAVPSAAVPVSRGLGLLPSPVDLSHMKGRDISSSLSRTVSVSGAGAVPVSGLFPATYDLRDYAKLTPVRDQGSYNNCWAYATYASMESNLLPSETRDFSEFRMATDSGFDWDIDYGGNSFMSSAYLARWTGPVNEGTTSPVQKHMQGMMWLPPASGGYDSTFINNVKTALTSYGAVYSTIYSDDSAFNSNYTYYYDTACSGGPYTVGSCTCQSSGCGGHAITIVGWNDNLSKSYFTSASHGTPAGDGAFLVKNSWGTSYGDAGYFYISYYDTAYGGETAVYNQTEDTGNYNDVYQYDTLGYIYRMGQGDITGVDNLTEWMANIFTASSASNLRAAGFYTTDVNVSYTVYVYTGVTAGNPVSGTMAYSASGSLAASGFHTVDLGSVPVTSGQKFSIVVRLTNTSDYYPVPVEIPTTDLASPYTYSSAATASSGQSYISSNGSSWTDLTTVTNSYWGDDYTNANVCLKAYATGDDTAPSAVPYVYDGTGADISATASSIQLSANWGASSDAESGISAYYYAIGTSAGLTNIVDWTSAGTSLSVTHTGLSLSQGVTYYVGVKAMNGVGVFSSTTWSDGQTVNAGLPSDISFLWDGTDADVDYTPAAHRLSANWGPSEFSGGTIDHYWYAIGSTSGGTDIVSWTDLGAAAYSVTVNGLSLTEGDTYYFSVKAQNNLDVYSNTIVSDGQRVDLSSPAATLPMDSTVHNGSFSTLLTVAEAGELEYGPSLYFLAPNGDRVPVTLTQQSALSWTAEGYIETYHSTGTAYMMFSATDAAGNYGSLVSSFTIDQSVSGAAGGTVSNGDGMSVLLPAGVYSGTMFVSISTVPSSQFSGADSASPESRKVYSSDLVREFSASDLSGTGISSFNSEVSITMSYSDDDNDGRMDTELYRETSAWIYYLDPGLGKWVPVENVTRDTAANTLTAQVAHFSLYSVRAAGSSYPDMGALKAYPNPCDFRPGSSNLTISGVPVDAENVKAYIYNEAGELVRTLSRSDGIDSLNSITWNGKDSRGRKAASGIYIYLVKTSNYGKAKGKIFAIW